MVWLTEDSSKKHTRSSKIPRDLSPIAYLAKCEKMASRFKSNGFIIEEDRTQQPSLSGYYTNAYVWYPDTALLGIERNFFRNLCARNNSPDWKVAFNHRDPERSYISHLCTGKQKCRKTFFIDLKHFSYKGF